MTEQTEAKEPTEPAEAKEPTEPAASVPAEPAAAPSMPTAPPPIPEPVPVPETPAPKKDRRALRAALRWTAAVVVFAVVGAGTAYGITGMERTDVPGLATASDGRWDYPTLTLPPLPSGSPVPFAEANKAGAHYADLRALVLPAPKGATQDRTLRGEDGWLATKDFLSEYAEKDDRAELAQKFTDQGLRHIAARGWTTPDGTHTRVYLLQFGTAAVVDDMFSTDIAPYSSPGHPLRDAPVSVVDEHFPEAARVERIPYSAYVEGKPYGAVHVRHAYLSAGDVLALVVQSRKADTATVPFQQTVTLQAQLLS